MKKIIFPAFLLFTVSAFAQNSDKPADVSASKLNTTRVATAKQVSTAEVKTKNVSAPSTTAVDQNVPGKQAQPQATEKRVKPVVMPAATSTDGQK